MKMTALEIGRALSIILTMIVGLIVIGLPAASGAGLDGLTPAPNNSPYYLGDLLVDIPPEVANEYILIDSIISAPPLDIMEIPFKNPENGLAEFVELYRDFFKHELETRDYFYLCGLDSDPTRGKTKTLNWAILDDWFQRPAFSLFSKIFCTPDNGWEGHSGPNNLIFPAQTYQTLWLKLDLGFLFFYSCVLDMEKYDPFDEAALDQGDARTRERLKVGAEEFLSAYRWLGREIENQAGRFKTDFGILNWPPDRPGGLIFRLHLYHGMDPYQMVDIRITNLADPGNLTDIQKATELELSPLTRKADKSLFGLGLGWVYPIKEGEHWRFSLLRPRTVAGRLGLEKRVVGNTRYSGLEWVWQELGDPAVREKGLLRIGLRTVRLDPNKEVMLKPEVLRRHWLAILDGIRPLAR